MISCVPKAHVIMLHDIQLLSKDELVEIVNELDHILRQPEKLAKEGFEDIHEALEAQLIRKIGVDVGGKGPNRKIKKRSGNNRY